MDIADIRRLTPATENCAYFQTSGFSPKPEPVIEEVIRWMRFQNQGPALPWVHEEMQNMLENTRARVARNLHADPAEIMLNENTTVGINVVANGIAWRAGDNVILSDQEHPGNRIVWYQIAKRYGVELRFLRLSNDYAQILERFEALIDGRTRVVSISHVSRETGLRLPARELVEIAHRHDVPILFDGAQAFGAIPVDVRQLNCDFYTCSGHKYIMAPQGTGAFYVRRDRIEWLHPSWLGAHTEKELGPTGHLVLKDTACRFEFATRNLADQAGFGKALEMWEEIGWEKVFARISEYTSFLKARLLEVPGLQLLTPLPYEQSSGIVTFRLPGFEPGPLSASLMEHERILVGPANTDSVRVSTHVFNTEEEAERLVAGLLRILKTGY